MSTREKVKEHPIMAALIAVSVLMGSTIGIMEGFGKLDQWVMSHAEFADAMQQYVAGISDNTLLIRDNTTSLGELKQWHTCDRLDRRIEMLRDRLWRLEQQGNGHEARMIRDAKNDLETARNRFNALDCDKVLAQ